MAIVYPTKTLTVRFKRKSDGVLETPSSPVVFYRRVGGSAVGLSLTLGDGLTEESPGVLKGTVSGAPAKHHVIAGSSDQADQVTPAELVYTVPSPEYSSNQ